VLLSYITGRAQFPGNELQRRHLLLRKISEAARCGVDYIQLREKDLSARDLEVLAGQAMQAIREEISLRTDNQEPRTESRNPASPATCLLINSRADVALAVGASGVHLRAEDISSSEVRGIWKHCGAGAIAREISRPIIAVSCHTANEVAAAANEHADFAVFGPVFGKSRSQAPPAGLEALRQACRAPLPVLALGGITLENAQSCLEAGAAGIAAIRLFQENDIGRVVSALRDSSRL
jgi:thiamine-phosphate pyrophosphorylase